MSKTLQGHRTKLDKKDKASTDNSWTVQYNRDRLVIVKRRPKKYSLSSRRNVVGDGAFLTDDGRLFHARAETTGKARSPSVERLEDGTASMERSWRGRVWRRLGRV